MPPAPSFVAGRFTRLHRWLLPPAPLARASDAMLAASAWPRTLLLVRSFTGLSWPLRPGPWLIRPLLTSRSGSTPSPFQAQGEISPGKSAILPRTIAASTLSALDHCSFAELRLLAAADLASYTVRVPRHAVSLHASSPHSVTLMQLRFASLTVACSREDFHLQDRAHAGRT